MPVVLGPAAAVGAATGVTVSTAERAVQTLVAGFAAFMRRRSGDVFPLAIARMQAADPGMDAPTASRLATIEATYEAEYQRKALVRITADLRIALANPDPEARRQAVQALLERERRYQRQREEAISVRALARAEQNTLRRTSPQGAYWMLSDYVREHTLDCLGFASQFWPWRVLERQGPPRHHGCPCYLIGLDEAKHLGLMTDDDVPDPADAERRARLLLGDLEEARQDAALAVGRAARRALEEGNLAVHAERELRRAGLFDKDSDYGGMVGAATLDLVRRFGKQGHSGFSAALVRDLFGRLADYQALTPLTDDPAEWNDVSAMSGTPLWQSRRDSTAFSEDAGKTYTRLDDKTARRSQPAGALAEGSDGHLEEGERGRARHAYDLRYAKGTVKGGEFRPRRGGHAARLPPRMNRERGRWTAISGHPVRVPERRWTRRVAGATYSSPAGSTNVYREGQLVDEPGREPRHRALLSPPTTAPGATVTDVPAARAADVLAALREITQARRDPQRRRIRDALANGDAPVEVGAGPDAIAALRAEGFTLHPSANRLVLQHPAGTLRLRLADGAVTDVGWTAKPRAARRPVALARPPMGWNEHAADALALADELGARYGAVVRVPRVLIDERLGDHAGRHEWTGEAMIGAEARDSVEAAATARAAGRPLTDLEARGAYAAAHVTAHEVAHGVNPIPEELFEGADANLEEALAEEASHPIALARLRAQGQHDVAEWVTTHPDELPVRGVYLPERGALASLLDRAGITEAPERLGLIMELKFRTPPAERMGVLADRLVRSGDFDTWDGAYDHVTDTLASRDIKPQGALPHDTRLDVGDRPAPRSPGTPLMTDRNGRPLRVGDRVDVAGVAGGIADTGYAIARNGRYLRYVSDRATELHDRERETPHSRATRSSRAAPASPGTTTTELTVADLKAGDHVEANGALQRVVVVRSPGVVELERDGLVLIDRTTVQGVPAEPTPDPAPGPPSSVAAPPDHDAIRGLLDMALPGEPGEVLPGFVYDPDLKRSEPRGEALALPPGFFRLRRPARESVLYRHLGRRLTDRLGAEGLGQLAGEDMNLPNRKAVVDAYYAINGPSRSEFASLHPDAARAVAAAALKHGLPLHPDSAALAGRPPVAEEPEAEHPAHDLARRVTGMRPAEGRDHLAEAGYAFAAHDDDRQVFRNHAAGAQITVRGDFTDATADVLPPIPDTERVELLQLRSDEAIARFEREGYAPNYTSVGEWLEFVHRDGRGRAVRLRDTGPTMDVVDAVAFKPSGPQLDDARRLALVRDPLGIIRPGDHYEPIKATLERGGIHWRMIDGQHAPPDGSFAAFRSARTTTDVIVLRLGRQGDRNVVAEVGWASLRPERRGQVLTQDEHDAEVRQHEEDELAARVERQRADAERKRADATAGDDVDRAVKAGDAKALKAALGQRDASAATSFLVGKGYELRARRRSGRGMDRKINYTLRGPDGSTVKLAGSQTWGNRDPVEKVQIIANPQGGNRDRLPAGQAPGSLPELLVDALGRADELGHRYDAGVHVTTIIEGGVSRGAAAHHEWNGTIAIRKSHEGKRIKEYLAARKADPGRLTDDDHLAFYNAVQIIQHEVNHGVGARGDQQGGLAFGSVHYRGHGKEVEEFLTEETAHLLAADWLRSWGMTEVLAAVKRNPRDRRVLGTYQSYRVEGKRIFDDAGLDDGQRRDLMIRMKFQMTPAERNAELMRLAGADNLSHALWAEPKRRHEMGRTFEPVVRADLDDVDAIPRAVAADGRRIESGDVVEVDTSEGKITGLVVAVMGYMARVERADGLTLWTDARRIH